jgi:hypothetical protein
MFFSVVVLPDPLFFKARLPGREPGKIRDILRLRPRFVKPTTLKPHARNGLPAIRAVPRPARKAPKVFTFHVKRAQSFYVLRQGCPV